MVLVEDMASIGTLAGNLDLTPDGDLAGSLAFAYNLVADNDTATIDESTVSSTAGNIDVTAEFLPPTNLPPILNSQIAALAVSGSGADQAGGGLGDR